MISKIEQVKSFNKFDIGILFNVGIIKINQKFYPLGATFFLSN